MGAKPEKMLVEKNFFENRKLKSLIKIIKINIENNNKNINNYKN